MRSLAGSWLLTVVTAVLCSATDESEWCSTTGEVEVCLQVDSVVAAGVAECSSGEDTTNSTGKVSVTGAVTSGTTFLTTATTSVTMSCTDKVASIYVVAGSTVASVLDEISISYATTSVNMDITSDVLTWNGTLVQGTVGASDWSSVLSASFTMSLASGGSAVSTSFSVDVASVSDDLDLPSALSYTTETLPFLSSNDSSCPFSGLTTSSSMVVPGVNAPFTVSGAEVDVCAFVSGYVDSNDTEPFLTISASMTDDVSIDGVTLSDGAASVSATYDSENNVVWAGSVSGSVAVLGTTLTAAASFSDSALDTLVVTVAVAKSGMELNGSVSYAAGEDCSSNNNGTVALYVASAGGLSVEGTLVQGDECSESGAALWSLSAEESSSLAIYDVTVKSVSAELASSVDADNATTWSGVVSGTVSFGTSVSGTATIAFDSTGVTSFSAAATLSSGYLTGDVSIAVDEDGVATGTGSLTFDGTDSNTVPTFDATVVYNSSADTVWDISASLDSVEIHSVTLSGVTFAAQGYYSSGSLVWSGSLAGTVTLSDGTSISVSASIEDGQFSSLTGSMTVSSSGLAFVGTVEITEDYSTESCTTIVGSGALALSDSDSSFASTELLYDACATEAGDVKYQVTASSTESLSYSGLTLSSAVLSVNGTVGSDDAVEWSGSLAATASLFGGTASAAATYSSGALQTASVSTVFMTSNGLLSLSLSLDYNSSCDASSTGTASGTVRLSGADDLEFDGTVSYAACTGDITVSGTVSADWSGPDGISYTGGLSVDLSSSSDGSSSEKLASRTWAGTVAATSSSGLSASISFNSSSTSSVSATLSYEDDHVALSATVGSDCTGSGTFALTDMPYSIPSVELEVDYSQESCSDGSEWTLTGTLDSFSIPFFGKTLTVTSASVTISSDDSGSKNVSIIGTFNSDFSLNLSFPLPLSDSSDIVLSGGVSVDGSSADSFATSWDGSGSSPLTSSLGSGSPSLFSGLKGLTLESVYFELSLADGTVAFTADGTLYGLTFDVLLAVQYDSDDSSWAYGMAFTASGDISETTDMDDLMANVLSGLEPAAVQFSIANDDISIDGVTLSSGFEIILSLGTSNSMVTAVTDVAPGDLSSQIGDASDSSSLELIASITSTTDITVYLALAGNIALSSSVTLEEVAFAFVISETGAPAAGFNVVLDFTVGSGDEAQTFEVDGFISIDALGALTVALSIDSEENWVDPFGINGVEIIFPLALSMTISAELIPTAFDLIGSVEVGGTTGSVTLGVDLEDFTKTAFSVELDNLDFASILDDVAQCSSCLGSVGNVLADVSMEKFAASFNPDLENAVTISVAGVSSTIDAGINLDIEELNLWNVINIEEATFSLSSSGITASLVADKLDWGIISITSSDGSSGPSFSMALTEDEQYLYIDGAATILGQSVSVKVNLSDDGYSGEFEYSLGSSLTVDVAMSSTGTPGDSDFETTISASLETTIISDIIDAATDFLTDLSADADSALESANTALASAESDLESAQADLESAQATVDSAIDSAEDTVQSWWDKVSSKKSSCDSKDDKCSDYFWDCPDAAVCWVEYAAYYSSYEVAEAALEAAEALYDGATDVASAAVTVAEAAVTAAEDVVSAAEATVDAFSSLVTAAGGALKDALDINSISVSATIESDSTEVSFAVDMTVMGDNVNFDFTADLDYDKIADEVYTEFRSLMADLYSDIISVL